MYLSYYVAYFIVGNKLKFISSLQLTQYISLIRYKEEVRQIILSQWPDAKNIEIEVYYQTREQALELKENAWQL